MSAPIIWIIIPLLMSVILLVMRKQHRVVGIIGASLCLFLALLALTAKFDTPIKFGSFQISLLSDLPVLGRRFSLSQSEMPELIFVYGVGAFWFISALLRKGKPLFVPIGLMILTILVAAMAVKPFIYAALLIEIAILTCIPLLVDQDNGLGKGILRFLTFQTLGMPFILLAGWFLAGGEITPISTSQLTQSSLLLGLGFAFWLGVFPLHTWIPMLANESQVQTSSFIFSILPIPVIMLLLDFLNNYAWLRDFPVIFTTFRWLGMIMVLTGGIWSLFQNNLKKLFGYVVLVASGITLSALGVRGNAGIQLLAYSFIPRILALALISIAMNVLLKDKSDLSIQDLGGSFWRTPFASVAFISAIFIVSGMPILAGYPLIEGLTMEVAKHSTSSLVIGLLVGLFLLFLCGLRITVLMFIKSNENHVISETKIEKAMLCILMSLNLLMGLFPGLLLTLSSNLVSKFTLLFQ